MAKTKTAAAKPAEGKDVTVVDKQTEIKGLRFFSEMIVQCGKTAQEHGFWDAHANKVADKLASSEVVGKTRINDIVSLLVKERVVGDPFVFLGLIVTECGEAMEACRKDRWDGDDSVWEELADVVIRCFDFAARFGTAGSLMQNADAFRDILLDKMAYNEGWPFLHGKKF